MNTKDNQQEALIQELENKLEAKIPSNLIDYVSENGSKILNKPFKRIVNDHISEDTQLWEVYSFPRINEVWNNIYSDEDVINLKLLPFGQSLGSPTFFMSLVKEQYGSIYIFDYDFGPTKVADSLDDFLKMLG